MTVSYTHLDIFLLDIDLGDCKGYEVGRELTFRESDPAIIYITGYSENVYNLSLIHI